MFKIKNDDQKSVVSKMSKTSKSVIDMSVNELLSLKIPLARSSSKVEVPEQDLAKNSETSSENHIN